MPETLAIVGLVMATVLYGLMVRRRASGRFGALTLSRALAASNEIALNRLHLSPRRRSAGPAARDIVVDGVIVEERRTGDDRRRTNERRRGRGRRSGGDRRRDASSV